MSQVGTIKQYHDGATYSLANVYDEKLTEYNILAGTSAKEILSISFNTDTGIDYYFDPDTIYSGSSVPGVLYQKSSSTATATILASSGKGTLGSKIITYLSNEHAVSNSGYAYIHSSYLRWLVIGRQPSSYNSGTTTVVKTFELIPPTPERAIQPSYEIEGYFFVDTSSKPKALLTSYVRYLWGIPTHWQLNSSSGTSYGYLKVPVPLYDITAGTPTSFAMTGSQGVEDPDYIYFKEFAANFFDEPFHIRLQFFNSVDNPNYSYACYVNGELLFLKKRTAEDSLYYCYYWDHIILCGRSYFDTTTKRYTSNLMTTGTIHVSNFRISLLSPIYQKITATNLPIRHNGANCYIPLTTNKANTSTPCLAVRHGNTNYYAIK